MPRGFFRLSGEINIPMIAGGVIALLTFVFGCGMVYSGVMKNLELNTQAITELRQDNAGMKQDIVGIKREINNIKNEVPHRQQNMFLLPGDSDQDTTTDSGNWQY